MQDNTQDFARITRSASKTFYVASLLYPPDVRHDIHILYAYLRISDDMVDADTVDMQKYTSFKKQTAQALTGAYVEDPVVRAFSQMVIRRSLDTRLIWAYFASQDIDLAHTSYATYADFSKFVHGVAEVVGLFMAQIMDLPPASYSYARKLGEAMQLVNIARDIDEDTRAGKCYIPQDELAMCNIQEPITKAFAHTHSEDFTKLMHMQLDRARRILLESRAGLRYFPQKYLLPIMVSASLYDAVIARIRAYPLGIFDKKVRPSSWTILRTIVATWWQIKVRGQP